jgi:glucuronate isomerase
MNEFLTEDFLLQSDTARELYHDYAEEMPILDYHCHLPPVRIAENKQFSTITEAWLGGDHYKWRAMRTNGVEEERITGQADDREKFRAWAETVPYTIGNPLFHWTHLELKRYFGIEGKLLNGNTADEIYDACNSRLAGEQYRARGLMNRMHVRAVCTTDDPADSLEHHRKIGADEGFDIPVFPAMRPDKAHAIEDPNRYNNWLARLEAASDTTITSYNELIGALEKRHDFFHEHGCRLSDHGIEYPVARELCDQDIEPIFNKVRDGKQPGPDEVEIFRTALLLEFGRMNAARGWVMQLHMGALRSMNSRMFERLGPDTGFDSIGDFHIAKPLAFFLDRLDRNEQLPKMIFYVLNPNDNETIATMLGNFQDGSVPGKMQFGSAWWFNDQKNGMEQQMTALANMGLLSRFVGMLTDSRSFLSYPRHEYFRRVLCNLIGEWVEGGEAPKDMKLLGPLVQDICYHNAVEYFNFPADLAIRGE